MYLLEGFRWYYYTLIPTFFWLVCETVYQSFLWIRKSKKTTPYGRKFSLSVYEVRMRTYFLGTSLLFFGQLYAYVYIYLAETLSNARALEAAQTSHAIVYFSLIHYAVLSPIVTAPIMFKKRSYFGTYYGSLVSLTNLQLVAVFVILSEGVKIFLHLDQSLNCIVLERPLAQLMVLTIVMIFDLVRALKCYYFNLDFLGLYDDRITYEKTDFKFVTEYIANCNIFGRFAYLLRCPFTELSNVRKEVKALRK